MNVKSKNSILNNKLNFILLITLLVFLFIPLFVLKFKIIPKTKLNGIADVKPYKKLTYENLYSNDFQKSFDNYFMRANALWGYLVKINNELSYRLFNQITFSYGPEAIVGKDGSLIQPMYFNSFNRQFTPDDFLLIKKANKLKKLENLLEKKGVKLLVVVNPNNTAMYSRNIPNKFKDPTRFQRENSYEIMKRYIEKLNIPFVDNYEYLMKMKNKVDFKFFEPTGSHLNEVGSCLGTNNLLNTIKEAFPKKDINNFPCFPVKEIYPPKSEDTDLLNVSNLLFPNRLLHPGHYVPEAKKLYNEAPLKLLFVGTSFNFAVQEHLQKRNIAKSKLYFYYKSIRTDDGVFHILDKRKINWQNDVFKNDVIILESNYSGLGGVGYSFLSDAIIKLKKDLFKTEKELKTWQNDIKKKIIKQSKKNNINTILESEFNPFENKQ
mgnify:CR=1 FL=1